MTAVELVEIAVEIVMTAAMFGVPAAMLSHDQAMTFISKGEKK